MCGIIAYVGNKNAREILLDGLSALEYRGYDSAGVCIGDAGVWKAVGPVKNLKNKIPENILGTYGIGHTRWATHGQPLEKNAHPHGNVNGNIQIVHNGIIENYKELKDSLIKKGIRFSSDTDSEVIAHLIGENLKTAPSLLSAVRDVSKYLRGTYGIAVMDTTNEGLVVALRMGSPLVLGVKKDERFIASDVSPLVHHTTEVVYLKDGELCVLKNGEHEIYTSDLLPVSRKSEEAPKDVLKAGKSGYRHFMEKEIMEAPEVIRNTIRGRILQRDGLIKLGGLESVAEKLRSIDRLIIVGCGTAYYAGLVGEYMIEEYAGIPVEVEIASEFRYRKPIFSERTALLAVSQSGETADTLEAVREAKRKGVLTLGIVNVVGSSISRETDAGVYNHAGPEVGVASTKAFISQVTALALLTVFLGRQRSMSQSTGKRITKELSDIPKKIEKILSQNKEIEKIAKKYSKYRDALFIGRKYNFPIALEGSLKLKEISYIHAEGYGSGEMKHGPLAMIDENFPTIAIVPNDSVREKNISNIQEILARKGKVFTVGTEGDIELKKLVDDVIFVPKTIEMLSPILSVIPLQLFAYHIARIKKLPIDKPRNLAKSVTVE